MKQRHFNQNPGSGELGEFRGHNFLYPPTRRKSCPKTHLVHPPAQEVTQDTISEGRGDE